MRSSRERRGPVAQWLEPAAHNGLVGGSSPSRPTIHSANSVFSTRSCFVPRIWGFLHGLWSLLSRFWAIWAKGPQKGLRSQGPDFGFPSLPKDGVQRPVVKRRDWLACALCFGPKREVRTKPIAARADMPRSERCIAEFKERFCFGIVRRANERLGASGQERSIDLQSAPADRIIL